MPEKATRVKQRKSVESYDPEFLKTLIKAATEGITIECPDRKRAVSLRHRLYSLRMAMKNQKHESYPLVERVVFSIHSHPQKGWLLVGNVGDAELVNLLRNAGMGAPPIPDLEL